MTKVCKNKEIPRRKTYLKAILVGFFFLVMILLTQLSLVSAVTYKNATDGFSVASDCTTNGGITRDPTDGSFWIACLNSDYAIHYTSAGINTTGAIPTAPTGAAQLADIAMNGTTGLWFLDDADSAVYTALKTTGANLTGGFNTNTIAGAGSVSGVYQNSTGNLFIIDISEEWCYNILNQVNQSDGWHCGWDGSGTGLVQMDDGTYYVITGDGFMEHYSASHVNLTDGFDVAALTGGSAFRGVTSDGNSLWVIDATDKWVYHLVSSISASLQTPADNYQTPLRDVEFNCSANVQDGNTIANISIYHNITGTYKLNQTTDFTATTPTEASSLFNISGVPLGNWSWSCRSDDNSSNTDIATTNRTFLMWYFADGGQNYTNETSEGSTSTFSVNLSYNNTFYTNIQGILVYNNTRYTGTKVGSGKDISFTRNIAIPTMTAETNVSFYWELRFLNDSTNIVNSTQHNQSVTVLNIDDCAAYGILLLNYTLRDERNQSVMDAAHENSVVEIDLDITALGSTTPIISFSQNYSANANPQVCLENDLSEAHYQLDVETRYDGDTYSPETHHIQNFSLTNDTLEQEINLYDLNDSAAQQFLITFKDSNFITVENALVDIQRKYVADGIFRSVEIPKTDQDGQAVAFLDLDNIKYTIVVTKYGVVLGTFDNIVPVCQDQVIEDCRLNLNSESAGVAFSDFETRGGLSSAMSWDLDTKTVTAIFTTTDGSSKTVLLNTTKYDMFGNQTVCYDTVTSSSGTLTCTVPDSYGNITVVASLFSDSLLIRQETYSITPDPSEVFGSSGIIMMLILMITIPLMLTGSPIGVILGVIMGLIMSTVLTLYTGGSMIGITSVVMWAAIAGGILIWKISRKQGGG